MEWLLKGQEKARVLNADGAQGNWKYKKKKEKIKKSPPHFNLQSLVYISGPLFLEGAFFVDN